MRGFAANWRKRAAAADTPRERDACLRLAEQYEQKADERLAEISADPTCAVDGNTIATSVGEAA